MDFSEKLPVVIGNKCYMCSLQLVTVKGGKQVLYLTDDGTIVKKEPLHRYKERHKKRNAATGDDFLLMCKDTPVYNISKSKVLHKELLPGAMHRGTMDYSSWMRTRYSAGSNVSARRLMLRAFGTDNHAKTLDVTRALSLSDCYWLKKQSETVAFNDVTPYLNSEWRGEGEFKGGSVSTLFVNGAADKRWLDAKTLLKVNSFKELDAYTLCAALGLEKYAASASVSESGILLTNFTSMDCFFESFEQSGYVGDADDARSIAVDMFKEQAVSLFVLDYLVEHDDRHWGNFGFIRDSNTGEYLSMAPYYDFDWIWSDGTIPLPPNALRDYAEHIRGLCKLAKSAAESFERGDIISNRASELLELLESNF